LHFLLKNILQVTDSIENRFCKASQLRWVSDYCKRAICKILRVYDSESRLWPGFPKYGSDLMHRIFCGSQPPHLAAGDWEKWKSGMLASCQTNYHRHHLSVLLNRQLFPACWCLGCCVETSDGFSTLPASWTQLHRCHIGNHPRQVGASLDALSPSFFSFAAPFLWWTLSGSVLALFLSDGALGVNWGSEEGSGHHIDGKVLRGASRAFLFPGLVVWPTPPLPLWSHS